VTMTEARPNTITKRIPDLFVAGRRTTTVFPALVEVLIEGESGRVSLES